MSGGRILWVDDEIDLLKSHIILLSEKGYDVNTVTSGEDAIAYARDNDVDLVFLDEMMPGIGGLEALGKIKELKPDVPVVMITKNEEESLMVEAIGGKISDYLTKPVNPSQVLLACKKFLEAKKITGEQAARDYLRDFNEISQRLMQPLDHDEWIDVYRQLVQWDIELDTHPEINLRQTLNDQKRECNKEFSKFVEKRYPKWLDEPRDGDRPTLTTDVTREKVAPLVEKGGPVFYVVVDCLRLDQWEAMARILRELYRIETDYYYSILPTSTEYARNALFAGLFPSEIEAAYPDLWRGDDDERSMNQHEQEHLAKALAREGIDLANDLKYVKLIDPEYGKNFERDALSYRDARLTAIVVNYLDMIAHGRSDSDVLKEIAPDEAAYRSLTESWFRHSSLLGIFRKLATIKGARVVVTTDHGSVRCMRGAKALGDRETSKNLRFKHGRNIKADAKRAIYVKDPASYKLPRRGVTTNYIIAKEDYYFVYPTDYHHYLSRYKDTFQHGGVSMEEMILPVAVMEPK
ncbi:MAG: PglZ domain-containing protein [Ignavibacteriales bacterium]|nr:PglZ domain-containing protein [Ignavibacteriales bacterium]